MKSSPYWIDAGSGRRIAILSRPRGGDWLGDEINAWKSADIAVAVSLLTPEEAAEFDLKDEAILCRDAGIDFELFPIVDRGIPTSRPAFSELIQRLHQRMESGEALGVHCRAGIGRSALVVAAVLLSFGFTAQEAFRRIQEARGLPVPETPEQRHWVEQSANEILASSP
jgi:protein-tyrosine phosphatase